MAAGKITNTEWVLLGMTAVFLCGLLALYAHDRAVLASSPVETARNVPQEAFMPELAPLDLNAASAEELAELPGIGPELARRIAAYREEHGPFETVEELMEVSGIGQGKLDGLEGRVTVENEGIT